MGGTMLLFFFGVLCCALAQETAKPTETPQQASARQVVITRSNAAIVEAQAEITAKPQDAERLNARIARLKTLVACLQDPNQILAVCHEAFIKSHDEFVAVHRNTKKALQDELSTLYQQAEKCSETDAEEACVQPIKLKIKEVKAKLAELKKQKEHNVVSSHEGKTRCEIEGLRFVHFHAFGKHVQKLADLIRSDPVDADAVANANSTLLTQMAAHENVVKEKSAYCELIKDEAKKGRCTIRLQVQLEGLRKRHARVERLVACAKTTELTVRMECAKRTLSSVWQTKPKLSQHCERQLCRKSFKAFMKVAKAVAKVVRSGADSSDTALGPDFAKLGHQVNSAASLRAECDKISDETERNICKKETEKEITLNQKRFEAVQAIQACSGHLDNGRRFECVSQGVRRARRTNACKHSKKSCEARTKERKVYKKFLTSFNTAAHTIADPSATLEGMNTAVDAVSVKVSHERAKLAGRKSACEKEADDIKRRRCLRRVRQVDRLLSLRQRLLNRLKRCSATLDVELRAECATKLEKAAKQATPAGCSNAASGCKKQNSLRKKHLKFLASVKDIATTLSGETFDVDAVAAMTDAARRDLNKRLVLIKEDCAGKSSQEKRIRCTEKSRKLRKRLEASLKQLDKLQKCGDHTDEQKRAICAKKIVSKVKKATPEACHRNVCARQEERRARYAEVVKQLERLASLVSATVVSVHDVNSLAEKTIAEVRGTDGKVLSEKRKACRDVASSEKRHDCHAALRELKVASRKSVQQVEQLQICASKTTLEDRQKCANEFLAEARKDAPGRCRKHKCDRRNALRRDFEKFLHALDKLVKPLKAATVSVADVNTAAGKLLSKLAARKEKLSKKASRCARVSSTHRRQSCERRARALMKDLRARRRIVKRLKRCGGEQDVRDRKLCVKRAVKEANHMKPEKCHVEVTGQKVHKKHRESLRRKFIRFVDDLRALGRLVISDPASGEFKTKLAKILGDVRARAAALKLECGKIHDKDERKICRQRAEIESSSLSKEKRYAEALGRCSKVDDAGLRKKCVRGVLRRARRAIPEKPLTRLQCHKKNVIRQRHLQFVGQLKAISVAVLAGGDLAPSKKVSRRFQDAERRIKRQSRRCSEETDATRKERCKKRITKARKLLRKQKRALKALRRCSNHADAEKRKRCVRRVLKSARRATPKGCPPTKSQARKQKAKARAFEAFYDDLSAIARAVFASTVVQKNVDAAVQVLVKKLRKRELKLAQRKVRCSSRKTKSSRRKCRSDIRKKLRVVEKQRHVVTKVTACTRMTDEKMRQRCVLKNLRKTATNAPRPFKYFLCKKLANVRRRYKRFLRGLKRIAALVSVPRVVLSDVARESARLKNALSRGMKRCKTIKKARKQARCESFYRNQKRFVKAMLGCAVKNTQELRNKCVALLLTRARRGIPRPCRTARRCKQQRRKIRKYAAFLRDLKAVYDQVNAADMQTANVTATANTLSENMRVARDRQVARRRRCNKIADKRERRKCVKGVRSRLRQLKLKSSFISDLLDCSKNTDATQRSDCATQLWRRAVKATPRKCRGTTNCALRGLVRHEAKQFIDGLGKIAAVVDVPEVDQTNVTSAKANVEALFADTEKRAEKDKKTCRNLDTFSKRSRCRRHRQLTLKRVQDGRTLATNLANCTTVTDATERTKCVQDLLVLVKELLPRACETPDDEGDEDEVSEKRRTKRLARLRKDLRKCDNQKCRETVSALLRIELDADKRAQAKKAAKKSKALEKRKALYLSLSQCGTDALCRDPILFQIKAWDERRERRRRRRVEGLTRLRSLQRQLRRCAAGAAGLDCRNSVYRSYELALTVLKADLNRHLEADSKEAFEKAFGDCASRNDVLGCRATARDNLAARLKSLLENRLLSQLSKALRFCSQVADAASCETAARASFDEDMAVGSDNSAAEAEVLFNKLSAQQTSAPAATTSPAPSS